MSQTQFATHVRFGGYWEGADTRIHCATRQVRALQDCCRRQPQVRWRMATRKGVLDFAARAREKQESRDADAADIASGRRSRAEVNEANSMFAALGSGALRNARIIFPEKK